MCPHCGKVFDPVKGDGSIPSHSWPEPLRQVCPGSGQHPRNPLTDRRPLWKDLPADK
jgi:hypothetical protein